MVISISDTPQVHQSQKNVMKRFAQLLILGLIVSSSAFGQDKVNPGLADFGGIYNIPEATVKPDPNLEYKIVVDIYSGSNSPSALNPALYNVARMINLHAVGGAPAQNLDIVLAIHAGANDAVMTSQDYRARHQVDNPNIDLIRTLKEAGVKLTVCGQSLIHSQVQPDQVLDEVEIATSMLTTVTTYQMKGYAFLKF